MADRSVVYRLRAEIGQFKAQMAQASASVKDIADKATAVDKQGEQFRRGLSGIADISGRVGLAAAGGLAAATKAAVDWESAWAGVQKTTDGTASQMAELEGQLRELARTMPATHQEIAATAEAAGQLGVAREDVADFTKTMIQLGETTNLTADEAATSIAQMANVMGTAPEDVDRLGAALVALGNDGASTERDIIQMSQRIAGAGAQIGLTEPQILAIANATASMGIEAEAGGTAISTAFTKMAMAVSSGGPKLEKFADIAGVSAGEFQRLFKETPADAFAAFTQGLDRINKSGGDVFGTLKEIGLSDIRVSQAMLSMAASGDLLTDSLKLGNEAWEENSALANEFAKRAGTTASEVQVAWNNIKDAGIELGATILPILSQASDVVIATADAFQSLPAPIKNASSAALGITAVLGGGLWFTAKTVSGIATMRQNLADLGIQAGSTRTRLTALNGIKFAGLLAALAVLDQAMEGAFDTRVKTTDLQRNLEALTRGEVSDDLKRLGDDVSIVTSKMNGAAEPIRETATLFGLLGDTALDKAASNIEEVDQALASMVEGGNAGEARKIFTSLLEVIRQGGGSQVDAIAQFDAFGTALDNAGAAAASEASALDGSTAATRSMGDAAATAAPMTEEMAKALADARDGAYETASGFVNLGNSLNDSKVSLGDWIGEMEKQAKALRDFMKNAQDAGKKGLDEGLIQSLQEAGTEGALRLEQLAGASEKEIGRANRAWRKGQAASDAYAQSVEDLAREVLGLPSAKGVDVTVKGVNEGLTMVNRIQAAINALRDKTITIHTIRTGLGLQNQQNAADARGHATGGLVTGPGGPTDDLIPTWLSNREYVVKASAVQKYGVGFFDAVNAERLASGGQPGGSKNKGSVLGVHLGDGILAITLTDWIKELEASRDALQSENEARQSLVKELGDTVAGKFTSSLFGSTDVWSKGGSLQDAIATLMGDAASANAFSGDVDRLKALGLDDAGALNALLSQADAATIANIAATATPEVIAQYEQSFQVRQQAVANAQNAAMGAQTATLAAAQDATTAEVARLNALVAQLTGVTQQEHKADRKSNKRGAGNASRNRKRG